MIATGWTIALIGGVLASAIVGYLMRRRQWEKRREDEIKLFRARLEQRQKAEEQKQWRENKRRRLFRAWNYRQTLARLADHPAPPGAGGVPTG